MILLFVSVWLFLGAQGQEEKGRHTFLWHSQAFYIVPSIHKTCPVASAGAKRKTVPSSEISEDSSNTSADTSITFSN